MSDEPESAPRRKRLSISKRDMVSGAATELIVLLETVTADGRITDDEAISIRNWLQDSELSGMPGIAYLRGVLESVLADGRVTDEERKEVYKAVERILPTDAKQAAKERRQAAETAEKLQRREEKHDEAEARRANAPVARFNFMVAGCGYYDRPKAIAQHVEEGKEAFFYREPDNPHDPNAIMIAVDKQHHIGYVPRSDAAVMAKFLDQDFQFKAYIKKVLEGRNFDIPVILAEIFRPEVSREDLWTVGQGKIQVESRPRAGCGCVPGCGIVAILALLAVAGSIVSILH